MKYRIKERPLGYRSVNGGPLEEWPEVGELVELTKSEAEGMIRMGQVEEVSKPAKSAPSKAETRPASTAKVEKRSSKDA